MFLVSHFSDKHKKRTKFLAPIMLAGAAITICIGLAQTIPSFLFFTGLYLAVNQVGDPLRVAVLMDVKEKNAIFWHAREVFLNTGRVFALLITTIAFFYQTYLLVFILFAVLNVIYPMIVKHKFNHL